MILRANPGIGMVFMVKSYQANLTNGGKKKQKKVFD